MLIPHARELMIRPRKFRDLDETFPACGPSTLSARLKSLEAAEVIKRRFYAEHPPRAEYLLSARGEPQTRAQGPARLGDGEPDAGLAARTLSPARQRCR